MDDQRSEGQEGREGGRKGGLDVPYINQGPHLSVTALGHFLSLKVGKTLRRVSCAHSP